MATKLEIYNLTLGKLGQRRLTSLNEDNENRRKLDNTYDQKLGELLTSGPELGWKFTKELAVGVDREAISIAAFTNYTSIVSGKTLVTTDTPHNLVSGNDVEIASTTSYDGDYEKVVAVSSSQFYVTATFVADDATGTVYWESDNYAYRYKIPDASQRVISVKVGGVEVPDWTEAEGYILTNNEDETVYMDYLKSVTESQFPFYFTKVLYLSLAADLAFAITQSSRREDKIQNELDLAWYSAMGSDEQKQYVQESSTEWVDAGR